MGLLPDARQHRRGRGGLRRRGPAVAVAVRDARPAGRGHRDDLPGPAVVAEPGRHDRAAGHRGDGAAPGAEPQGGDAEGGRAARAVGIPDPKARLVDYPHQLSGGMRQRALIAMALACNPRLLIADEPTTALDVTIQAQILALLKELVVDTGTALVMITHDLGVVAGLCDEVNVLYGGKIVERGGRHGLFAAPAPPLHGRPAATRSRGSTRRAARRSSPIPGSVADNLPWDLGVRLRAALPQRPRRLHAARRPSGRATRSSASAASTRWEAPMSEHDRTDGDASAPDAVADVLVEVTRPRGPLPDQERARLRPDGRPRPGRRRRRPDASGAARPTGWWGSPAAASRPSARPSSTSSRPRPGSVRLRRGRHRLAEGRGAAPRAQALPDGLPGPDVQPRPAPDAWSRCCSRACVPTASTPTRRRPTPGCAS